GLEGVEHHRRLDHPGVAGARAREDAGGGGRIEDAAVAHRALAERIADLLTEFVADPLAHRWREPALATVQALAERAGGHLAQDEFALAQAQLVARRHPHRELDEPVVEK